MITTFALIATIVSALALRPDDAPPAEPSVYVEEPPAEASFAEMLSSMGVDVDALDPDARALAQSMSGVEGREFLRSLSEDIELSEAQDKIISAVGIAQFNLQLETRTGDIDLEQGLATLHLNESFRFVDAQGARSILVDGWGNPPAAAEGVLGMIIPGQTSPLDDTGWGVVITYSEDGHVSDEDAEEIDYDELLAEMREADKEDNEMRKAEGYPAIHVAGWAEPPHYDGDRHRLYWAKELRDETGESRSLNYAIRVLGRKGVLELNAVADMSQLPIIKPEMERILGVVEFNEGHRYLDFDPDLDDVAAYGIGGLIAGKVAMKAGLFAGLLKILIAAKKFLILGAIALGAAIKGLLSRRKSAE